MLLEPLIVALLTALEAAACVAILVLFWRHVEEKEQRDSARMRPKPVQERLDL